MFPQRKKSSNTFKKTNKKKLMFCWDFFPEPLLEVLKISAAYFS